jgi:ABC-2 type transport system ATP-binding protein
VCEIRIADGRMRQSARDALAAAVPGVTETDLVLVAPADGTRTLSTVVRVLDAAGVDGAEVALRHPTLDEVFLALTGGAGGHGAAEGAETVAAVRK